MCLWKEYVQGDGVSVQRSDAGVCVGCVRMCGVSCQCVWACRDCVCHRWCVQVVVLVFMVCVFVVVCHTTTLWCGTQQTDRRTDRYTHHEHQHHSAHGFCSRPFGCEQNHTRRLHARKFHALNNTLVHTGKLGATSRCILTGTEISP